MTSRIENDFEDLKLTSKPARAKVWHHWRVIIPNRTILGRLVRDKVWRRHDGRRWIYKPLVEYDHSELTVRRIERDDLIYTIAASSVAIVFNVIMVFLF